MNPTYGLHCLYIPYVINLCHTTDIRHIITNRILRQ